MPTTPEDMISQLDQFSTHLENIAKLISKYRSTLLSENIPTELADQLCLDFQKLLWTAGKKE